MSFQQLTVVFVFTATCLTVSGMFDDILPFYFGDGGWPVPPPGYHYETRSQISRYPRNSYKIMPYGVALATGQLGRTGSRALNKLSTRSIVKRVPRRSRPRPRPRAGGDANDDVALPGRPVNDTETPATEPPIPTEDDKRRKRNFLPIDYARTTLGPVSDRVKTWEKDAVVAVVVDGDRRACRMFVKDDAGRTNHVVVVKTDDADTGYAGETKSRTTSAAVDRTLPVNYTVHLQANSGTVAAPYLPIVNKLAKSIVPGITPYQVLLLALNAAHFTSETVHGYLKTNKHLTDVETSTVSSNPVNRHRSHENSFYNKWNSGNEYNHYEHVHNLPNSIHDPNVAPELQIFDKIGDSDVINNENDDDDFYKNKISKTIVGENVDNMNYDADDKNGNGDSNDGKDKYNIITSKTDDKSKINKIRDAVQFK